MTSKARMPKIISWQNTHPITNQTYSTFYRRSITDIDFTALYCNTGSTVLEYLLSRKDFRFQPFAEIYSQQSHKRVTYVRYVLYVGYLYQYSVDFNENKRIRSTVFESFFFQKRYNKNEGHFQNNR